MNDSIEQRDILSKKFRQVYVSDAAKDDNFFGVFCNSAGNRTIAFNIFPVDLI
jgi:hypothetical protein